jgi:hypothetical protein
MANWNLLSEHRPTGKGLLQTTWPHLTLGIMLLGFGVMMLFVPTKPGEETFTRIAGVIAILGSLALVGVAPWRLVRGPTVVRIYEEGLEWHQGGREHQRPWEEVREVYRKEQYILQNNARPSDWNRRSDLRLVFTDSQQTRFNHLLSDYNRLADSVEQATTARLLPEARAALAGGGATFGALHLDREGLQLGNEAFGWGNLSKVWAGNGYLGWYDSRGIKREVALADIPNHRVVLRLLEERTKPAGMG